MSTGGIHLKKRAISPHPRIPWYFVTTVLVFWLPIAALAALTWRKLDAPERNAFWRTSFLVGFLTFIMEFVYRRTKIWGFSEKVDPLLGLRIGGEPIEEFCFWMGATPFMLLVYLTLRAFRARPEAAHG